MELKNLVLKFDNLIYSSLYSHTAYNKEEKSIIKEIIDILQNDDNIITFINSLMQNSTKENKHQYIKVLKSIIAEANISHDIILNSIDRNFEFSNCLFLKLSENAIIKYIKSQKNISEYEMNLINAYIKKSGSIVAKLLGDKKIYLKFPNKSLDFIYTNSIKKYIDINKTDLLDKLTDSALTSFIKKEYRCFKDFSKINKLELLQRIDDNSLLFPESDNDNVIEFIINNPLLASKFNTYYFDLMSKYELLKLYKNGVIKPCILISLVKSGISIDEAFSFENISKCANNSIDYNPFDEMSDSYRNVIIREPKLLNKFNEYIIFQTITKYLTEEEIVTNLRNPIYLREISSYVLELILNNLSFKSLFNMIQNHLIFDSINNLNVVIKDSDKVFVRGYLDSTILINKTSSNMLYNLLSLVDANVIYEYLSYPYILEKINNKDFIQLLLKNNIDFNLIIDNEYMFNKLDTEDIVYYINELWKTNVDLSIISNPKVLKRIFNINKTSLEAINFEEVNYLFETIRTKDVLSIQYSSPTVMSYYAVLCCYKSFGIKETINIIISESNFISMDDILNAISNITRYKVREFRNNNYALLQNLDTKIVNKLKAVNSTSLEDFETQVMNIPFLDAVTRLIVSSGFATVSEVIAVFYNYKQYEKEFKARKELKDYCDSFTLYILNSKKDEYTKELVEIAKKNCVLRENIVARDYQEKLTIWLRKVKLKLFIKALNGESVGNIFRENDLILDIREKFATYLNIDKKEINSIISFVLIPLANDSLSIEDCLNKLGIKKPKDFDTYQRMTNDINILCEINSLISELTEKEKDNVVIEMLNYVVYGTPIIHKPNRSILNKLKKIRYQALEIFGEIYIDKSSLKIIYGTSIDIEDELKINEYSEYIKIIETICEKTRNYINRHIDGSKVKSAYFKDFELHRKKISVDHAFNSANYEIKKRLFTLKDLERILKGYNLNCKNAFDSRLGNLLFGEKMVYLTAFGLFDGTINNLGYIISSWDNIMSIASERNLDFQNLDVFEINKLAMVQNSNNLNNQELTYVINSLSCDTYYYDIPDVNSRVDLLLRVYNNAKTINSNSIPMLGVSNDDLSLSTLDYHDVSNYLIGFDSDYRIGGRNSDLLTYSVLSKDGIVLVVRNKDGEIIGRINGIRNGNALFLTEPCIKYNIDITNLLLIYSRKLLDYTKQSDEPINIVVINNYDWGINIDSSTCSYINNPVVDNATDYGEVVKNKCIIKGNINDNFSNGNHTILCSNLPINKDSFSSYNALAIYPRIRNDFEIINGICDSYQIDKIESIITEYIAINNIERPKMDYESFDKIYLFDDAVILIDKDSNITSYVLPFDERAIMEVESIINSISKNKDKNKNTKIYS